MNARSLHRSGPSQRPAPRGRWASRPVGRNSHQAAGGGPTSSLLADLAGSLNDSPRVRGQSRIQRQLAESPRIRSLARHAGVVSGAGSVQAKLTIGPVDDPYEREADHLARVVVRQIHGGGGSVGSEPPVLERAELHQDDLQRKPAVPRIPVGGGMEAPADLETAIRQAKGGGRPLPGLLRSPMEQAFGTDFSGVRLHTDPRANQLSRSIRARAFTAQRDIFLGPGEYEPGTRGGQELLAHELTHVVQQTGGG